MKIGVYHKGWLLHETNDVTKAWEKAQQYRRWYSDVEVKKIADDTSERISANA